MADRIDHFWGAVQRHGGDTAAAMGATMGDGPTTGVPFRLAGHLKNEVTGEGAIQRKKAIAHGLQQPVELHPVDPRNLMATQGSVTREGVAHYLGPQFHENQTLFADKDNAGNAHPTVYQRDRDQGQMILSGHHRATAALLNGKMLDARVIKGP